MKVKELIEELKKYDEDMLVCYELYSEQCLLEMKDLDIRDLCLPRPDGWVQDKRPDMQTVKYLVFPGN